MAFSIAIYTEFPGLRAHATLLGQQLSLPVTDEPNHYDYLLILTPDQLSLQKNHSASLPLFIDFLTGKIAYRRQHTSLRRELIAKAMGLKGGSHPTIIDATAGLGRDSFILASLGFEVTLLERSPIIHALLEDGLKRAALNAKTAPIIQRMHLIQANAITWLSENEKPQIIYLDPMFPERTKSSSAKKEMQIFQDIIGEDLDADNLLKIALACATQRVVVKRPRLSKPLGALSPSYHLTGSSSRFDIYLT